MDKNRRQHYRITYPSAERARFVFGTVISEVIECSERGMRFRAAGEPLSIGTRVTGRIAMRHGKEIRISGTVVRCDDSSVALNLDRVAIPFLAIMREQLYLRHALERYG
jgi:hypothetical protein